MTEKKDYALQDRFLNILRKERTPVAIYLKQGTKLLGVVSSFDQFAVSLDQRGQPTQLVYKHSICTIVPTRPVSITHENPNKTNTNNNQQ